MKPVAILAAAGAPVAVVAALAGPAVAAPTKTFFRVEGASQTLLPAKSVTVPTGGSITKGEPTNPHTPEELTAKFFELGESVWGRAVTQTLHDGLMGLEDIGDFREFTDRLASRGASRLWKATFSAQSSRAMSARYGKPPAGA